MSRLLSRCNNFLRRAERGVQAIEFALLAPIFLVLLFGIIESSVMLFDSVIMEGAAQEAARQVRTGVVQNSADPQTEFKTLLCDNLFNMMSCGELTYLVESFPNFTAASMPDMFDEDGNLVAPTYADTQPGDIVIVRVARLWTFMSPLVSTIYGKESMQLITTVVFRNEPFDEPGT